MFLVRSAPRLVLGLPVRIRSPLGGAPRGSSKGGSALLGQQSPQTRQLSCHRGRAYLINSHPNLPPTPLSRASLRKQLSNDRSPGPFIAAYRPLHRPSLYNAEHDPHLRNQPPGGDSPFGPIHLPPSFALSGRASEGHGGELFGGDGPLPPAGEGTIAVHNQTPRLALIGSTGNSIALPFGRGPPPVGGRAPPCSCRQSISSNSALCS
jgi:hypothetical protein